MRLSISLLTIILAAGLGYGQNWVRQDSTQTQALHSVSFIDTCHGWAVGHAGTILKTTNGGSSWATFATGTENDEFSSSFVDAGNGWTTSVAGIVRRTTNGGFSWVEQTTPTNEWLRDIVFLDVNHGWAVGQGGIILHTVNGGTEWIEQPTGVWRNINCVTFLDSLHGFAAGSGIFFKTTNGGVDWLNQTNFNWFALYGIDFVDTNHGWMVGDHGQILHTEDGGANWTYQSPSILTVLWSVAFIDTLTGWAVGDGGLILHTTNGGVVWTPQASGTTNNLESVTFADDYHGWAVGASGTILHYHGTPGQPQQPTPFHLCLPTDSSVITTASANLFWCQADDPDPDNIPHYDVWVDTLPGMNAPWMLADSLADSTLSVSGLLNDHQYYWTVRATDNNTAGTWADDTLSFHMDLESGADDPGSALPSEYYFAVNYPNPFNAATRFEFGLPNSAVVKITVFDILGREVDVLMNAPVSAGKHAINWNGDRNPSGTYLAVMSVDGQQFTRKLMLLK